MRVCVKGRAHLWLFRRSIRFCITHFITSYVLFFHHLSPDPEAYLTESQLRLWDIQSIALWIFSENTWDLHRKKNESGYGLFISLFCTVIHFFLLSVCLLPPPSLPSLPLNLSMSSNRLWNEDRYCGVRGYASEPHRKCVSSSDVGRPKLWLLKHFFHGEMSKGCVMLDENNLYSVSCPSLFLLSAMCVCVCSV